MPEAVNLRVRPPKTQLFCYAFGAHEVATEESKLLYQSDQLDGKAFDIWFFDHQQAPRIENAPEL
jgi:hypothetical protein